MRPSCRIAAVAVLLIPIAAEGAGAQDPADTKTETQEELIVVAGEDGSVTAATSVAVEGTAASDAPVLVPLYASFVVLQALDVVSTWQAASDGGVEANPFLRTIAPNPPALIAVKSAQTIATIWLTEKLRKKNRVAGIALLCGLNSAYAVIVARNFRY